jgi:hypothetical protein
MNSRNRKFVLIGGLFVLAVVGSTAWTKRRELFPDPVMKAIRSARSELRHASGDVAEREKARRVNSLYEATLAKHSGLQVIYRKFRMIGMVSSNGSNLHNVIQAARSICPRTSSA